MFTHILRRPALAIVISLLALSVYRDEAHVSEMLRAGARGYLLQDDAEIDLVSAIRVAHWAGLS